MAASEVRIEIRLWSCRHWWDNCQESKIYLRTKPSVYLLHFNIIKIFYQIPSDHSISKRKCNKIIRHPLKYNNSSVPLLINVLLNKSKTFNSFLCKLDCVLMYYILLFNYLCFIHRPSVESALCYVNTTDVLSAIVQSYAVKNRNLLKYRSALYYIVPGLTPATSIHTLTVHHWLQKHVILLIMYCLRMCHILMSTTRSRLIFTVRLVNITIGFIRR